MIDAVQDDDPPCDGRPLSPRPTERRRRRHTGEVAALSYSAPLYGRMSLQVLATVTALSAGSLSILLGLILTARTLTAGVPYQDVPAALIAIGGATSLACLASATAYFAQQAYLSDAEAQAVLLDADRAAKARGGVRSIVGAICHAMTVVMTAAAYIAFAIGGVFFIHFCLAAMPALTHAQGARG